LEDEFRMATHADRLEYSSSRVRRVKALLPLLP
jgi:hypothetical protein